MLNTGLLKGLFSPDNSLPRWALACVALGLAACGFVFWHAAVNHGEAFNRDPNLNDQAVYIHMAQNLKAKPNGYIVPRMRMPLYAVYLSWFDIHDKSDEEALAVAMRANVLLSLVCIATLAFAFHFWLGWRLALLGALLSGFTWFIERAAYVQPEVLLATLVGLTCATLAELLRKPAWWKAVLGGLLLAGWHMTKASGPVIMAIFLMACLVKLVLPGETPRRSLFFCAALVIASFILPILPYTLTTYRIFGSPFYNTQSKFFLWCDDAADKHALQVTKLAKRKPTPEELADLPTPAKYFASHTADEMYERLAQGYRSMMNRVKRVHPELVKALKTCFKILAVCVLIWWRRAWALLKGRPAEFVFVGAVTGVFTTLFAWMDAMKVGPRILTSIHLVPLFFCLLWIRELTRDAVVRAGSFTFSIEKLVAGCVLLPMLVYLAWLVMTQQLPSRYFGL